MLDAATCVQHVWRRRAAARLVAVSQHLRNVAQCVVCADECVKLVRCSNGHSCCMGCVLAASDNRCPLCREVRAAVPDTTIATTLAVCGVRLRCHECGIHTSVDETEFHRAWCPSHRFVCPWSTCSQCVRAVDMAEHVAHHSDVHRLTRQSDGRYHLVVVFARAGDAVVVCVGNTTVVVNNTTTRRLLPASMHSDGAVLQLGLRAYYPTSMAPALRAVVRQLRVSGDDFTEEHRYGVVPPMIASRESVVLSGLTPTLTSRSVLSDAFVDSPLIVAPNVRPGPALGDRLRQAGLRDAPQIVKPFSPMESHALVAVVHLCFCEDRNTPIGALYEE